MNKIPRVPGRPRSPAQDSFPITPIRTQAKGVLAAFACATLALAVAALLLPTPPWIRLALAVGLLALAGLLAYFLIAGSRASVFVDEDAVRLDIPVYGRSIPRASIDSAAARAITFGSSPQLRPRLRTNGMSVPGYHVGWYRLTDGSRALAALTAMDREVAYVPLVDGTAVLLSVRDPKDLVARLG